MEDAPAAPVAVLLNRAAGSHIRLALRARVESALEAAELAAVVHELDGDALAAELQRRAHNGGRLLAVAGGDGTIRAAAEALAGGPTALAVIPTGTLNHFARRIGVPDVGAAARALALGTVRAVPAGYVGRHLFLNTATLGLYADVVRRRERMRPWIGKWPAAAISLAIALLRFRRMEVTLEAGGRTLRRRTPLVWIGVGSGAFGPPQPPARPYEDEGDLEVVVLRPAGRLAMLGLAPRLLLRWLRRSPPVGDPALDVFRARELVVSGRKPIGVTLDGEPVRCAPPLYVCLEDEAVRVVVPPGSAPADPAGVSS